ncbi:hypothetical protein H8891_05025 [Paeniclostridium sp. NSJ-45]|uniref:Uncharacterized protein n=1 Tax=Paeniclostridium hominis TaxID=2764329 RepID=A0ABR7K2B0_9FIRM|nr:MULTISPECIES: hypothetical protein [Paeniclostridium]MBC6003156.1 hypothetical protein [Paeniclostridium hominis]
MCINLYKNKISSSNQMIDKEYDLLRKIYTSIENNNLENTKVFTQELIDQQSEKNNENISYLEEALNNLKYL